MSIFAVGVNHKTAPITLREKIYFAADKLPLYLQDLLSRGIATEAVLISTCNRSELYCEAEDANAVIDWFCLQTELPSHEVESVLYVYRDEPAVQHMMQVACGLDSMILGESQILGQMKEAFSESCAANAISGLFHRLFHQVFAIAKEVRTATAIGACPVSVAGAAVHFAKQAVDVSQANIVLIGAGDMTELLLRYLKNHAKKSITIVNRSRERARVIASDTCAKSCGLEELPTVLATANLVFSATNSPTPLIHQDMMMNARTFATQSITLIDLAVPRDIDLKVAELPNVKLYCIDDLKAIIETNRQGREHAAEKAREIIQKKSKEFINEWKSFDKVAHTIRAYRTQIETISHTELRKAKQQLQQGVNPNEVLEVFAYALTNKLLHAPSVQLRQAGVEGRFEILKFAKQLFAIPDHETERL